MESDKEGLSNYNPDSSKDPVVKDTMSISMIQTVFLGVEMPKMDFWPAQKYLLEVVRSGMKS